MFLDGMVPTLVPKPGPPTVTQEHLPGHETDALRSFGLPWVTLDREICSLKSRVSVARLIRIGLGRFSPCGRLRRLSSLRELIRPWLPINQKAYSSGADAKISLLFLR
jgi:hypothetical protein